MFFGSVTVLSVLLATAVRLPIHSLLERRFRWMALLWLAVGLHLVFVPPPLSALLGRAPLPGLPPLGGVTYMLSLSLLILFAWANRRILGVFVIGLGLLMNATVICANGGQMPVSSIQLEAKGELQEMQAAEAAGEWSTFSIMTDRTRLGWLGDNIPVPLPFRTPVILSLGDLVIAAGILVFFLVIPEARASRKHPADRLPGAAAFGGDEIT